MTPGHSKGTSGKMQAGTVENPGNEKMMASAPKASSTCNSHLVFATLQSQIIAARREPAVTAGKKEEQKLGEQTESRETMEDTTPTGKVDRQVSWGTNEVIEYHEEDDVKDLVARRQVEDDVNMIGDDGGNVSEEQKGTPHEQRQGYKKKPLQEDVKKKAGKQQEVRYVAKAIAVH